MQSHAADGIGTGFAQHIQTLFVCNIGSSECFNQNKLRRTSLPIRSKPLKSNAVRKMGVDLLPDRKLAASISGHRRIGQMYTTLNCRYATEICLEGAGKKSAAQCARRLGDGQG
jgi:hypothetical protein